MKFRFIGDPRDNFSGAAEITVHGIKFNRKDWTDVDDPKIAEKLLTHTHFESDFEPRDHKAEPVPHPPPPKPGAPASPPKASTTKG